MNIRRCQKIAERIDAALQHELQQGIDCQRMLHEPRYARDVLLVCDAFPEGDLPAMARHFRAAAAETRAATPTVPVSSGFSPSRFFNSIFGPASGLDLLQAKAGSGRRRGWFGRADHDTMK